jgi:UDP-2,4-diacetamido-2,4,6-trideoxy-beta-L-altropyranose hydrolase
MRIVIRADASEKIGSGHVMRCLTLATLLRDSGGSVEFVTRMHPGDMIKHISNKKFKVHALPSSYSTQQIQNLDGHGEWLGVKQSIDSDETIKAISNKKIDWLIIDHYALDYIWEKKLRPHTKKIMVIDDLANRRHDCDVLLDQNLFKDMLVRYQGKIPKSCVQLLGPKYALLHSDYTKLRKKVKLRRQPPQNILVFYGGVDQHNLTGLTLEALDLVGKSFNGIDVVISKQNPNYERIKNQINSIPNVQLYSDLPSLAHLMLKADLAIGAGGATTWERLCLGLPALVTTLADNQRIANSYLSQLDLIDLIGDIETVTKSDIVTAVDKKINCNSIDDYATRSMNICLGQGSVLVANTLISLENYH